MSSQSLVFTYIGFSFGFCGNQGRHRFLEGMTYVIKIERACSQVPSYLFLPPEWFILL